jgi:hypothetical protein
MRRRRHGGKLSVIPSPPNPIAIGVALGGHLLDLILPRPKLRAGYSPELSLLSPRSDTRTASGGATVEEIVGPSPVVAGATARGGS